MDQIRVIVFRRAGRKFFEAQWTDPETGRKKTQSTKKDNRRDAERFAGGLEKRLRSGLAADTDRLLYDRVIARYRSEYLAGLGETTRLKAEATLNRIAKEFKLRLISSLNEDKASRLTGILRAEGLAEATIKGHLAEIRKLLRWAFDLRLIERLPKLRIPRKTEKMKGRPITAEEFERMLAAVPSALKAGMGDRPDTERVIASWRFLLRGLWWSGLRIGEAVALHWTDHSKIGVDLSGKYPMFVIDAGRDKGRQDRVFPIAPEFGEMLLATPKSERRGFVFNPVPLQADWPDRLSAEWVSRVVGSIGEEAGVKVAAPEGRFRRRLKPHIDKTTKQPKPPEPLVKFASAHDLRRAFGVRWSQRVLPPVLQQMMRHESLTTTMTFYVGRNAEAAAQTIHEAHRQLLPVADKIANTSAEEPKNPNTLGGNRTPIVGSEVQ